MSQAVITAIIIAVMCILFFTEMLPLWMTSLLVPVALQITGVLDAESAWGGMHNSIVIAYIGIFMMSVIMQKTSLVPRMRRMAMKIGKGSKLKVLAVCMFMSFLISGFLSPTAGIALMGPILVGLYKEANVPRNQLLKSCTDIAFMGGFCVLPIGDSLVQYVQFNSYLEMSNAVEHMNMIDMFVMKIPIFIVGFLFILFVGHRFYSTAEYEDTIEAAKTDDGKLTELSPAMDRFAIILFFASVVAMVGVNATNICPMYVVPYISVAIALLAGLVKGSECLKAINWNIIFMIAGTLPLSAAISNTGLGETIASAMRMAMGTNATNMYVLGAVFFLVSCVLTQFMSNTAITAAFFPIAIALCTNLGIDPRIGLLAVYCGNNTCFGTPMATPTEAYTYNLGGFTMKEYLLGSLPTMLVVFATFMVWFPIAMQILY